MRGEGEKDLFPWAPAEESQLPRLQKTLAHMKRPPGPKKPSRHRTKMVYWWEETSAKSQVRLPHVMASQ